MANVLVLAPHADDEILGCGGTMAQHISQGDDVYVSVLTNASVGAPELYDSDYVDTVRRECQKAHHMMRVTQTFFSDLPAPQLEQYPQYKIAKVIETLIRDVHPSVLYVPHRGDLHLDHGAVYNAALVAARPFTNQTVKHVFSYETLSETEWGHPTADMTFIPNKFVDISGAALEAKLEAIKCFDSQLKEFPHPRSIEGIKALASYRGVTIGVAAAEAFMVIRSIS